MNTCAMNKGNNNDNEELLLKLKSLMYFFIHLSFHIITDSFIIITTNEKLIKWVWCCKEEMAAQEYEQVRKCNASGPHAKTRWMVVYELLDFLSYSSELVYF